MDNDRDIARPLLGGVVADRHRGHYDPRDRRELSRKMKRTGIKRYTRLGSGTKGLARKVRLHRTAHSTPSPSPEDDARFAAMRDLGCLACKLNEVGHEHRPTGMNLEIHHQLSGGRRIGHAATVCLCHYHHQGKRLPLIDYGYREQSATFGPSLERQPRLFREVYGTDEELLEFQNTLLAIAATVQAIHQLQEGTPA